MSQNVLLISGVGALAYYLYNNAPAQSAELVAGSASSSDTVMGSDGVLPELSTGSLIDQLPVCPDGTVLLNDSTCCYRDNVQTDGSCGVCPVGSVSAFDESGSAVCCPSANLDSNGVCQACPIGTVLSADGSSC